MGACTDDQLLAFPLNQRNLIDQASRQKNVFSLLAMSSASKDNELREVG